MKSVDMFLEELIVHRELSDNLCYYPPHYDSLQGAWDWARTTLMDHGLDKHEISTRESINCFCFLFVEVLLLPKYDHHMQEGAAGESTNCRSCKFLHFLIRFRNFVCLI